MDRRWSVRDGVGVWSMHFIGMLACAAHRHGLRPGDALSLLIAVCLAALPCGWSASRNCPPGNWSAGADHGHRHRHALHRHGRDAHAPGIDYDPLFGGSLLIAVGPLVRRCGLPSACAQHPLCAPAVRCSSGDGVAIVGMHYTGMAAARLPMAASAVRPSTA
jgi:NO-binding membrane sensor protein with MHYT domain